MDINERLERLKPGHSLVYTHILYVKDEYGNVKRSLISANGEGYVGLPIFEGITSSPPPGGKSVANFYIDPVTDELVLEYD